MGITFKKTKNNLKALEILTCLNDRDLQDKNFVVTLLELAGLFAQSKAIKKMSVSEYEDFIVNNLAEE